MSGKRGVAEGEGDANPLVSRDPNSGSIPRPLNHDLSQRQKFNQLSHIGALVVLFL